MENKRQTRAKVLISAALYSAGGVETHVQQLCSVLVAHGAEVTVVTRSAARDNALVKNRAVSGVRLRRSPLPSHPSWLRLSTLYSLLTLPLQLTRDFDLLYTVGPGWQEITRFTAFLAHFVRVRLFPDPDRMRSCREDGGEQLVVEKQPGLELSLNADEVDGSTR